MLKNQLKVITVFCLILAIFTVRRNIPNGVYYDGDFMTMNIFSEYDCYFRIIHVDVNGESQIIYPINETDDNFIKAGQTRFIPDNYRYRLTAPFGEEYIHIAAYDEPFIIDSPFTAPYIIAVEISDDLLSVENENGKKINPFAVTGFKYIILPK